MIIAAIQCPLGDDRATNLDRVEHWVQEAAKQGAQVILPPELFQGPYFPQRQTEDAFAHAEEVDGESVRRLGALARALGVAIPVSFFERAGQAYFNSVAVLDADGSTLGVYRKSHIPDGPGYMEKYYFRPGDTGFRVWATRFGRLGVGICWDQWFPEAARAMTLLGAEVLLYPTAIGSEPVELDDTAAPWRRAMVGHAVVNAVPLAAANRIGVEHDLTFYGTSFLVNHRGDVVSELGREDEGLVVGEVDLASARRYRDSWGFFRDRRPDLYGVLLSADGSRPHPKAPKDGG